MQRRPNANELRRPDTRTWTPLRAALDAARHTARRAESARSLTPPVRRWAR